MHWLHQGVVVPNYERLLRQCYTRFLEPGNVVLDVGSHSGLHFAHFIELVGPTGRVIGFEPIRSLAEELGAKYASLPNAEVRPIALSDSTGRKDFFYLAGDAEQSGFKIRDAASQHSTTSVQTDTLDHQAAALPRLDYIKIDIEGAEIDCLRGATGTVKRHRPLISVEYGHPTYSLFGNTAMSLYEWATANAYAPWDLFGNLIASAQEWDEICDLSYWDYFLIPEERTQWWSALFARDSGRPAR
jgi:FkbM family methyltransferase